MPDTATIASFVASFAALASAGGLLSLIILLNRDRALAGGRSATPKETPLSPVKLPVRKRPLATRATPTFTGTNDIERTLAPDVIAMHEEAVARGEETYIDPDTGFTVFTRLAHLRKGRCCGCRCRHCPYGHINVPGNRPKAIPSATASGAAARASALLAVEGEAGVPQDGPTQEAPHSVVYTKTGDKGTSALFTGERRKKTDVVFDALGAVDELSSHVGLARAMLRDMATQQKGEIELMATLEEMQQELLNAGTVVATPAAQQFKEKGAEHSIVKLLEGYRFPEKTMEMEKMIDTMDARLEPLRIFILPGGGNMASAQLHVCRTTCRRAERCMIAVGDTHEEKYTDHLRQATVYVNRLSDFFFVAARSVAEEDIVRKYD
ncbi:corrinoid adenosyltransferase MMAB-like [Bactrocera neohumeralis]|uniref:corrinoid adenosyltransferase MMAB-like n=1 Tax=Bactrocera neohumeralis TaxID=98809 RepID=UPI002164F55C|nr:corrinoid adenosyltransferase MMAB-like [Bactrocera neohumeralis]